MKQAETEAVNPVASTADSSSCSVCHTGEQNSSINPFVINGSGEQGKHSKHQSFGCSNCHNGYESNGSHQNGTLDARNAVIFNGVNPSASWNATNKSCNNMNCHGNVSWTTTQVQGCNFCHVSGSTLDPVVSNGSGAAGKHVKHATFECSTCHNGYLSKTTHKNGELNASGSIVFDAANPSGAWTAETKTCNNMNCHGPAVWNSTQVHGCSFCHTSGSPLDPTVTNGSGAAGKHTNHAALDCNTCHNGYVNSATHKNGELNAAVAVAFGEVSPNGTWAYQTKTCSNLSCHGDVNWNTAEVIGCALCHVSGSEIDPKVTGGTGASGKHVAHDSIECSACHLNYKSNTNHSDGNLDASNAVHFDTAINPSAAWNGEVKSCNNMNCHGSASWASTAQVGCKLCHTDGSQLDPKILSGSGISGKHLIHSGLDCSACHKDYKSSSTHNDGTMNAAVAVMFDPATNPNAIWSDSGKTCATAACHRNYTASWNDPAEMIGCKLCHLDAMGTNTAKVHHTSEIIAHQKLLSGTPNASGCIYQCHDMSKSYSLIVQNCTYCHTSAESHGSVPIP